MAKKTKRLRITYTWIESRKQWRGRANIEGLGSRDRYGETKDEVDAKFDELEAQVDAGLVIDDNTTLLDFAKTWYAVKTAGMKFKSAEVYANAINAHIAPFFKNIQLREVRPLNIKQFLAAKAHMSKSAQSKQLSTLRQIFDEAKENGLVGKNPCEKSKAGGADAKEKTPLTSDQQDILCEAVKGTRAELFVLLCLYAGLRREEALGLMWQNVYLDTDAPYIHVRHTVTFEAGRPSHSDNLKTDAAGRSIPIPPQLSEALTRARTEPKSLLVIPAKRTGAAMSLSAFRRMWEIVVGGYRSTHEKDKAGKRIKVFIPGVVDFHVEPHVLRHTYITELCASGMDIKKIQYLAGHEDVAMTLRIYVKVKNSAPEELSPAIIRAFSGSKQGSSTVVEK